MAVILPVDVLILVTVATSPPVRASSLVVYSVLPSGLTTINDG
jgi:hypothetical protein